MIYLELFLGFLKVGLFSFGGAYSAVPLIRDVVTFYGWMSDEMLTYMIAVSESTPGPIMVNLATYVGSSQAGITGAAVATLSVVLPSFFVILLIMGLLKNFMKIECVQVILQGMKPCVIGIILATGFYMMVHNCFPQKEGVWVDDHGIMIMAGLVMSMWGYRQFKKKKMPSVCLIILSAFFGMLAY